MPASASGRSMPWPRSSPSSRSGAGGSMGSAGATGSTGRVAPRRRHLRRATSRSASATAPHGPSSSASSMAACTRPMTSSSIATASPWNCAARRRANCHASCASFISTAITTTARRRRARAALPGPRGGKMPSSSRWSRAGPKGNGLPINGCRRSGPAAKRSNWICRHVASTSRRATSSRWRWPASRACSG